MYVCMYICMHVYKPLTSSSIQPQSILDAFLTVLLLSNDIKKMCNLLPLAFTPHGGVLSSDVNTQDFFHAHTVGDTATFFKGIWSLLVGCKITDRLMLFPME